MQKLRKKGVKRMESTVFQTTTGMTIYPYKKGQSKSLEFKTSMKDFGCKFKRIETTGFIVDDFFVTYTMPDFFINNEFPGYNREFIKHSPYKQIDLDIPFDIETDFDITEAQFSVINQVLLDDKSSRWFLHCPQGFGKTFVSISLMSKFRVNAMVICYSTKVLDQWRSQLKKTSNFPITRVLLLDSGLLLDKILNGNFPIDEYNIFLVTPVLLTSYAKKHGYDKYDALMRKMQIGLKIYDEAHRNVANIIKIDAMTSVKNTIYLSGDFAQGGKYRTRLYHEMFSGVTMVKPIIKDAYSLRYTDAVVVEYDSHPSAMEKLHIKDRRGMSIWKYMEYQFKKGILLEATTWIIDHILKLNEPNRRILVLTSMVKHCEFVTEYLKEKYPLEFIGRYHSQVPKHEADLTKNEARIIVATYASFSTGIDTKNIKYVISTSATNRVEDSQASGRARPLSDGESAIYWMLVDTGFDFVEDRAKDRIDYLTSLKIRNVSKITYEGEKES